jgi:hypothetical protein
VGEPALFEVRLQAEDFDRSAKLIGMLVNRADESVAR